MDFFWIGLSDIEWLWDLLDTCEEEQFFDNYDERFEEILFAQVVFCRICMFVDEEVGELGEVVDIGISWISEKFWGSDLFGKIKLSGVGGECIGRHIMGIVLL